MISNSIVGQVLTIGHNGIILYLYSEGCGGVIMSKSALLEKALNSIGGREQYRRKYQEYERSLSYVENNKDELLKEYKDNWIAVYHSIIIAYSKKPDTLIDKIKKTDAPFEEVFVEFVTDKKEITLF